MGNEAVSIGLEDRGSQGSERPVVEVWGISDTTANVAVLAEIN